MLRHSVGGTTCRHYRIDFWAQDYLDLVRSFTLDNFREAWTEPVYRALMFRALGVAAVTTITVIAAFPVEYFVSFHVAPAKSNRVGVTIDGAIAQIGEPQQIYRMPVSRKVDEFIGSTNFLDTRLLSEDSRILRLAVQGLGQVSVPKTAKGDARLQRRLSVGIRLELLALHKDGCHGSERCAHRQINDV